MGTPLPGNSSQTARLMVAPPGFAVGWQEAVTVSTPVAGNDWSYKVPGGFYERLIACKFSFNTSAAVASRYIEVHLADSNGALVTAVPAGWAIPASSGVTTFLSNNGPAYDLTSSGDGFGFLPDIMAPAGWSWKSLTVDLDGGDIFSGIVLLLQRFPDDAAVISVTG